MSNSSAKKNIMAICPICDTVRQEHYQHCETCAWYFPLVKSTQYLLELNQAKQQYKLLSTLDKIFVQIETQNKIKKE